MEHQTITHASKHQVTYSECFQMKLENFFLLNKKDENLHDQKKKNSLKKSSGLVLVSRRRGEIYYPGV